MASKVTPSTPGAPSFCLASAYTSRSVSILQTWTYNPQKRQDFSAFALTYILLLRSCKFTDAFVISSLPSLLAEKTQTAGPLCSADITLLHRSNGPIRHPLAVDRFPGWAGYTIYLALDLPRFRGEVRAWDQGIWSDGILSSCFVPFFCSAPGRAILPPRPARRCGRRAQRRSRTAPLGGRPEGLVLDGREHDGRLVCAGIDRMPTLVVDWGEIPDRRVAAARIVEAFDELEHRDPRLGLGFEQAPDEKLALERGEEALAHGVVVGVSDRAHRG